MSQVRASHILVADLNTAVTIKQKIAEGASFTDLAKQHSTCPSGQNGGDLGMFGRGMMVKPFEEATYNTEIGQVTGPVQTQFGYHLIYRTA